MKTKTDLRAAQDFASEKERELINEGRRHGEWTNEEKAAVILSRELANKYVGQGVTDFSLEAALKHFAAHLDARRVSVPLLQAYDEFHSCKTRERKSRRYLQDIETTLKRFASTFKDKLAVELSEADVERYLCALNRAPVTIANHHRLISVFLGWCHDRGYVERNAAKRFTPPTSTAEEPGILTTRQTRALMAAACPEILPAVALSLFAGLRVSEIARLDWQEVDVQHGCITVKSRNAKTNRRRVVTMPENLKKWLAPFAAESGPVAPTAQIWRNRTQKAREAAQIEIWPHNAGRHSFASYAYDFHQDAAKVAVQLGHDVAVLETNYKGLVKPGEGQAYFAIFPQEQPDNVISIHSAA